jgi:hypothetical protein
VADELFSEYDYSSSLPLRTDTALRLTPLLNGEELSRLSDSELKDFLRNLPMVTMDNRHGKSEETDSDAGAPFESLLPSPENGNITTPPSLNVPSELKQYDGSLRELPTTTRRPVTEAGAEATEMQGNYSAAMNAPLSESMAASLLFAASVARKRGWNIVSFSDEEEIIQGNLHDLRKMQSSRQYEAWQKQDRTTKH